MRKLLKRVASLFLIPLTRWYLRKERAYTYRSIRLTILPGVFHPGLFSSTKFLLEYLAEQNLRDKLFLELGCGSGLISIFASKAGARVTASDLSVNAIHNAAQNAARNHAALRLVHSDLFDQIDSSFDMIVINPPYYAYTPKNEEELAWNCGPHFEYFQKLFQQLPAHIHRSSQVIMVLTLGCDLKSIFAIAETNGFQFELAREKNVLFDGKNFIYTLKYHRFA
jgi:release factor glutamine methyltransferase